MGALVADLRFAVRTRRRFRAFFAIAVFMFAFCVVGLFMPFTNGVPLWSVDLRLDCEGTIIGNLFNEDRYGRDTSPPLTYPLTERERLNPNTPPRRELARPRILLLNPGAGYCRRQAEEQVTKLGVIAVLSALSPIAVVWVSRKQGTQETEQTA